MSHDPMADFTLVDAARFIATVAAYAVGWSLITGKRCLDLTKSQSGWLLAGLTLLYVGWFVLSP